MLAVYREPHFVQAQTPGARDVLVLEEGEDDVGKSGGIKHFGYRLTDARDIDRAASAIEKAGGKIKKRGEFVPGEPYVFFSDPDGYEVEVCMSPNRHWPPVIHDSFNRRLRRRMLRQAAIQLGYPDRTTGNS